MSDIKFLHFNNDEANRKSSKKQARANRSRTFAVQSLTEDQIKQNLEFFIKLEPGSSGYTALNIGVAKTSLDDNYSRKTGREIAATKMQLVDLKVQSVTVNQEFVLINFSEYEGVELVARLNRLTGFSTFFGKLNGQANKAK